MPQQALRVWFAIVLLLTAPIAPGALIVGDCCSTSPATATIPTGDTADAPPCCALMAHEAQRAAQNDDHDRNSDQRPVDGCPCVPGGCDCPRPCGAFVSASVLAPLQPAFTLNADADCGTIWAAPSSAWARDAALDLLRPPRV